MALPHSGANNASPETIRSALDRIVSRQQFPSDADYNAFVAAQPATADKIIAPPNERVDLEKMRSRQITEPGAAVTLSLAIHGDRTVLLTNAGPGATVDLAAFAVAKTDGQPIERVELVNTSANVIALQNGAGATSIPVSGIAMVESINSTALARIAGGGIDLTAGVDGSVIVQVAGADARVQGRSTAGYFIGAGVDGAEVFFWEAEFAGIVDNFKGKAPVGNFTATVDIGDGTTQTPVTGLTAVNVNAATPVSFDSTGANAFAIGDFIRITTPSAAAATGPANWIGLRLLRTGA